MHWIPITSTYYCTFGEPIKITFGQYRHQLGWIANIDHNGYILIKLNHSEGTVNIPGTFSGKLVHFSYCKILRNP